MTKLLIVTGADDNFFGFLLQAVASLRACGALDVAELAVVDQGLSAANLRHLRSLDAAILIPTWPDFVPEQLRNPAQLGLACRPFLRELAPGFDVYLWFDADAWCQDSSFVTRYTRGALTSGAATALENGPGYTRSVRDHRWWIGNHLLAYGPVNGLRLAFRASVNIGLLALSATAPHWEHWQKRYAQAIQRTGKVNLDQHAFHAAVHLDRLATSFLDARDNWLPVLRAPVWDEANKLLCVPDSTKSPISVVHLAGPDKGRNYILGSNCGPVALTYSAICALKAKDTIERVL